MIDLNAGNHSLTNLSIADVIDMTSPNSSGVHTLTIVGDNAFDHVNIPTASGTYHSAAVSTEAGFDVYTYTSTTTDPTVVLKVEQVIDHPIA